MDYGHELLFGAFLTPGSQDVQRLLRLVQVCEQAGLDLVTFQDHPYQPRFMDTWTLLSFVAMRTTRIHLAPNVVSLPLRQPAMLAKAVATLDRLTGGRVELGLGAGFFWDAIVAMGGPRRTPGEAVQALREAILICRGLWDTTVAEPLTVEGVFSRVVGVERGPAPAHPIRLWVGGYRPRMLRLIGELADGWLPSWSYLRGRDDLRVGNALIDEAALRAGRTPAAVRRLLNVQGRFSGRGGGFLTGLPRDWAEQLSELVLEFGVSAFLLASDDQATLERFAGEVVPAVRALVQKERARGQDAEGAARDDAAQVAAWVSRIARLPAGPVDYWALPRELIPKAITPLDPAYDTVRSVYMAQGRPALILRCASVEDVVLAVHYAATQRDVPLSVRSGGHGIAGLATNDGGIVIDLSRMHRVTVLDPRTRRFRAEPGATWGHVAQALEPYGLVMTSGNYGDVGVGGLAIAGGLGWLVRKHGLTVDHVRAVEMVLADGRQVRADAEHEPDLFWAARGAGWMMGVVTAVEFEGIALHDVVFAVIVYDARDTVGLILRWAEVLADAPREVTSFLWLFPGRHGRSPLAQAYVVYAGDQVEEAAAALALLLRLGPVLHQQAVLVPYAGLVSPYDDPHVGQQTVKVRNGFLDQLQPDDARAVAELLHHQLTVLVELRSMGGAVRDVDPLATAFAHRTQQVFVAPWFRPAPMEVLDEAWGILAGRLRGMYAAYTSDIRPERLADAFPPETLARLRVVKRRYDPTGVFRRGLTVTVEPSLAEEMERDDG